MPKKRYTIQVECIMLIRATFWISSRNIAQMVERLTFNQRVTGSSPVVPVAFIAKIHIFYQKAYYTIV